MVYVLFAASTSGRLVSVCPHTGVMTKAANSWPSTGPPAESEWAVEPTGVLTISPSPRNRATTSPSTSSSTSSILNGGPARTTTSLSPRISRGPPPSVSPQTNMMCSATRYSRRRTLGRYSIASSGRQVGEEPEAAEVDAEDRHLTVAHLAGRPQDGAVAAEHQGHVGGHVGQVALPAQVREDHLTPGGRDGRGQPLGRLRHVRLGPVAEDEEAHVGPGYEPMEGQLTSTDRFLPRDSRAECSAK